RKRSSARERVSRSMRSPHLHRAVRLFCLAGFAQLAAEQERGAELEFALEQHATLGRPALYAYRPLVRSYVSAHADRLANNADALFAIEELMREPAAAIFTHGSASSSEQALFRSVL